MENVCVVLVTFNRKELLLKLLDSLFKQTKKISSIVIVDNHSTDGTSDELIQKGIIKQSVVGRCENSLYNDTNIYYYTNAENTGGSGGFQKAFEIARNIKCDYIWTMDDDVLPNADCLENLLKNINDEYGVCIPNRTTGEYKDQVVISFNWKNPFKSVHRKKLKQIDDIKENTEVYDFPFEGPLLKKEIVDKVGVPNADYFIFFDDSDYALRCLKYTKILFVLDAHLHKQIIPQNGDTKYNWREYYYARNEIVFDRKYNKNVFVALIRPYITVVKRALKYTIKRNPTALKYSKKAFKDGKHKNLGKTVNPGEF